VETVGREAVAVVALGLESTAEIFKKEKENRTELWAEQLQCSLRHDSPLGRKFLLRIIKLPSKSGNF